jgi:hypothetical protein
MAFRYPRRDALMAALFFLVTMVVPGDAAVLPLPAQFGLHHLAGCSSFFFFFGAPAHLGIFMFSLLITLVCIAVFAWFFKVFRRCIRSFIRSFIHSMQAHIGSLALFCLYPCKPYIGSLAASPHRITLALFCL